MATTRSSKLLRDYEAHRLRISRATAVATDSTPAHQRRRITRLEAEYTRWFEYYFPHYAKARCADYHRQAADLLTTADVCYLVYRVFRGGAKSVHANLGIPLYLYLVKKDLRFMLLVGENEEKAKKLISDIQLELTDNQKLIHDYGSRFQYGDWAQGRFMTSDHTRFWALGMGQSCRGVRQQEHRPDYISVDDIDTKQRSRNPKRTAEAYRYLTEDVWGTYGKGKRRYVQSNNRFAHHTAISYMSEHFENINQQCATACTPTHHHIIAIKAITTIDGRQQSSWPECYTIQDLQQIRHDIGTLSFEREYQDNPIEEGSVFRNQWIHYKPSLPLEQYSRIVLYGDLSYTATADYKAIVMMGKWQKEYHVIRTHVRQTTNHKTAQWLYDTYESLQLADHHHISYYIEGSFAQHQFVQDFDAVGRERGYTIPVQCDMAKKPEKYLRIESMTSHFERGDIYFDTNQRDTIDMRTMIEQLLMFEKGSRGHDDGPDALQSALHILNQPTADLTKARFTKRKHTHYSY